jgi:hypothetical protein
VRDSRARGIARVAVVSAAAGGLAAVFTLGVFLPAFNTPHTDVEGTPREATELPMTPGLARQIAFVVVDGLGYPTAKDLPELADLRRRGVLRPLTAPLLTYTGPSITAMVTGLDPADSGVRLNGVDNGVADLDSVTAELAKAHVPIEVAPDGFERFPRLLRAPADARLLSGPVAFVAALIERRLGLDPPGDPIDMKSPTRRFTFVHIEDVDDAGHQFGAASQEYLGAAHHAAEHVLQIARSLDLSQDTLVVLSDHNHLPTGGHGGDEPGVDSAFLLVVGGGFVRQGVSLAQARPMRDVAPTLSVLAGVRAPTSSLGRPMFDLFSVDDDSLSVLFAGPFDQAARFACALHGTPRCAEAAAITARLAQRDPAARVEGEALLDDLAHARSASRDARAAGPRRLRMLGVGFAVLALAAGFAREAVRAARAGARPLSAAGAAAPIVYLGAYAAILGFAFDYRVTFSTMKPTPLFIREAFLAAGASALLVVALAVVARLGSRAPGWLVGAVAAPFALVAAWVGWSPAYVVTPTLGALVFLLAPAIPGAALAAIAVALVEAWRARGAPESALSTSAENR